MKVRVKFFATLKEVFGLPIQSFDGISTRLEEGDAVSIIPPMFAG